MKFIKSLTALVLVFAFYGQKISSQVTFLDNFLPLLRIARERFMVSVQPKSFEYAFALNVKNKRTQPQFMKNVPFFCDINGPGKRSETVPTSVHALRVGDIDIVGAIGDSLTTGASTFSLSIRDIILDGKGSAWSIGGQYSWRQFLTIPNILKEFNPKLYGFSLTGHGNSFENSSRFNVAEILARTTDAVFQAKNLVKRLRSDAKVNVQTDWKLVTIMIGAIDFCTEICLNDNQDRIIETAAKNLHRTLRILRDNLPRTMVNVVLPPDAAATARLTNKPAECLRINYFECPCFYSLSHRKDLKRSMNTVQRWYKRMKEVVKLPEFHQKNDFEVNVFSLFIEIDVPRDSRGQTQYQYLAKDCFHLSQLGHARAANAYWNAMLTPENQRDRKWKKEFEELKCPTTENQFLKTTKNS